MVKNPYVWTWSNPHLTSWSNPHNPHFYHVFFVVKSIVLLPKNQRSEASLTQKCAVWHFPAGHRGHLRWGTMDTMAFGFTSTQPWLSHSKQKFNGLTFQHFRGVSGNGIYMGYGRIAISQLYHYNGYFTLNLAM